MKNKISFSLIAYFFLLQLTFVVSARAYISTQSAPVYCNSNKGYVVFQGLDNGLYRIDANDPELFEATWNDALDLTQSKATRLGVTLSQPCVKSCLDGQQYVYYQSSDNQLCRVNINGEGFKNFSIQDNRIQTKSTPCVDETGQNHAVYFQCFDRNADLPGSLDNDLCAINEDGTGFVDYGYKIASPPYFVCENIYWDVTDRMHHFEVSLLFFQGFDKTLDPTISIYNHLCSIRPYRNGYDFVDLKQIIASRPWVSAPNLTSYSRVYFQTLSNDLCSVQTDGASFLDHQIQILAAPFGLAGGSQCYFYGMDQNSNAGLFCLSWEEISSSWQRGPLALEKEFIKSTPTQNAFSRPDYYKRQYYLYMQDKTNRLKALPINLW